MPTDTFAAPGLIDMDRAHDTGLLNWHRADKLNPYEVQGEWIPDAMGYAYDSGRRLGIFLHGVRAAELSESDRVNAETLRKLRALEDPRQAARFRGLFGGA